MGKARQWSRCIVLAILLVAIGGCGSGGETAKQESFRHFIEQVNRGEVSDVVIDTGDQRLYAHDTDGNESFASYPANTEGALFVELRRAGVEVSTED
jgi:hypothetical protein